MAKNSSKAAAAKKAASARSSSAKKTAASKSASAQLTTKAASKATAQGATKQGGAAGASRKGAAKTTATARSAKAPARAPGPFPPVSIPSIPLTGNYCIWRINKTFDGPVSAQLGTPYRCQTGPTRHSASQITFRVFSNGGANCDQPIPGIPANFRLEAKGATIHRQDGFAHFFGTFTFINGATNTRLFNGTIELIGRIGSHQFLDEKCDEDKHVEGWLVGSGLGNLARYSVRAVLTGQLSANLPQATAAVPAQTRLTGVIVKAP